MIFEINKESLSELYASNALQMVQIKNNHKMTETGYAHSELKYRLMPCIFSGKFEIYQKIKK